MEIAKDDPDNAFLKSLPLPFVGGNTYDNAEKDWNDDMGAELTQFRDKVGQDEFDEANAEYNERYGAAQDALVASDSYQSKSDEDKAKELAKLKGKVRDDVFREHGFHYKKKTAK
jgi:hypothetical protein